MNEEATPLARVAPRPQPARLGDPGPAAPAESVEALAASQALILERIASGAPLAEVLHSLVAAIEAQAEGLLGSLLLLDADGAHLRHGAAPSLPDVYCRAVDGMAIGPQAGSCGTAAYTGQPVIVADIATDPLWRDYRHLALPHGLRACWSQPVLARDGAVLGTFAIYYREPRGPTPHERRLIEMAAHVASIAIERARSDRALREREASFRLMFASSPLPMWVHDLADLRFLEVNDAATAQYGYSREEFLDMRITDLRPLEDASLASQGSVPETLPEAGVWRHRRKDGGVIETKVVAHTLAFRGRRAVLVVAEDVTEPRRRERHLATLARLDHELGSAAISAQAARIIAACAGELWPWDAFGVDLYDGDRDLLEPILAFDVVDGRPLEACPPARAIDPRERRALEGTGQIVLREPPSPCLLLVPVRAGGRAIGILTMQARGSRRYDEDDLRALQDLADRGGGALERIRAADGIRRSEERLRVQYAVTRILAECASLQEAGPALMETLCCVFGWQVSGLWLIRRGCESASTPGAEALCCAHVFPAASEGLSEFLAVTRRTVFLRGQGLPGRVWASGQAMWVADFTAGDDVSRGAVAARSGLHGWCAFPLSIDGQVVGVLDFFGQEVRKPDRDLLLIMSDVGHQIGQFVARRRAEGAVRESEARYRTLFASSMDAIFMADREGRLLEANPATLALFGYSEEEIRGLRMSDVYVGGSAAYSFLRTIAREGGVQDFEVKMRRRDGKPMDCIVTARARRDPSGRVVRYEGIIRDVTGQRLAERGLRDLSAHLLRVQDDERRRLARELHDSTGQDLAALAMNLAVALQDADALGPRGRKAMMDSQSIADRCAKGLRTLSYLLHPPLLDEMGLVAALRWLAEGFQARSGIHLTLRLPEDLGRLGAERETALFRIVQEALTNVHRHSGSVRAWVRLAREGGSVRLEIRDDGAALPAAGRERPAGMGVGIAGMRERARQLGGWLEVSTGREGTTVRAAFPLSEER